MHKVKLSALVILLVLGLAVSAIPATTTASSVEGESGSVYLNILGDPELFVSTLRHNVTVYRDTWGVPHIYARDTSDAYYALGYVMAQDRLFEMDLFRRATAGRLAELFGQLMFEDDVLMRTLGIYKIAEDTWNGAYAPDIVIPSDVRKNLEQFSRGVNDYIANLRPGAPGHLSLVPFEYRVLNTVTGLPYSWLLPYNWTPPDSVAIAGMMGLMLTDSSGDEIMRGAYMSMVEPVFAAQGLPGITDFLMPTGWINMTTIMPPDCPGDEGLAGIQAITTPLQELLGFSGLAGSNNWVVNGTMTATGNAMLCNDPHLNLQFPGINWQVHMKTDDMNVIGCCIPGGPVVYTGHNDYFAFGVTNLMADVLDLYYYVANATHYWYVDHWEPFTVTYETILNVTTPVTISVVSTRHGPLITTPMPPPYDTMAFRWAGREKGYGEVIGFSEMMRAKNLTEWRESLEHMVVIIQNFVYADKEGNIAWSPSGAIPVRDPTGVPTYGVVPSNGSAGQNEWLGWIPRATSPTPVPGYPYPVSLPYSENPKQCFIATANNPPIDPSYPGYPWPVWIGPAYTFDPGYRAQRITELITSLAPITIDDMKAIQADSLSIPARNFVPYILSVMASDTNVTIQAALGWLATWNYTLLRDSVPSLIFQVWYEKFEYNTFADEFGPFGLYPFPNTIIPLWNMTQTWNWNPYALALFDNINTPQFELMPNILNQSLHDAIDWIASEIGPDPTMASWQYGRLHVVQFEHPLGELLGCLNVPPNYAPIPPYGMPYGTGPVACDGGPETVDPGGHYHKLIVSKAYLYVDSGASYRGIYECKDNWDTSLILVPPGESGLVTGAILTPFFNPHCNDTFLMWLNNQYTQCLFNDTIIKTVYEMKVTFYGIQLWGDIDNDGIVDISDIVIAALAFGSRPEDDPHTPWNDALNWNPVADLNGDNLVDISDLVRIAIQFGERLPADP